VIDTAPKLSQRKWNSSEEENSSRVSAASSVLSSFKWLAPGMRVKRYLGLVLIGFFFILVGFLLGADRLAYLLQQLGDRYGDRVYESLVCLGVGGVCLAVGLRRVVATVKSGYSVAPQRKQLVEVLYERRFLENGLKVVAVGGGTGLSTLLRGLKAYTSNIVAVVTVSDDGGSSGKLRKDLGIVAPGDIRNCLVALSDDESLMKDLFDYRFQDEAGSLGGHSFGNLFLAALTQVSGDFEMAVRLSSQILTTRGRVLPATLSPVTLCAQYQDGRIIRGESAIPGQGKAIERVFLEPEGCTAPQEVIDAISQADMLILGPGSLYTSIVPNLLIQGVADAIRKSNAPVVYVCNVMTQPGETDLMGAAEHLESLLSQADIKINYAVVNIAERPEALARYQEQGSQMVDAQLSQVAALGIETLGADLLVDDPDVIRHDSAKLARLLMEIANRHRNGELKHLG
jgi:uncharacterized cofD-like protein